MVSNLGRVLCVPRVLRSRATASTHCRRVPKGILERGTPSLTAQRDHLGHVYLLGVEATVFHHPWGVLLADIGLTGFSHHSLGSVYYRMLG